jgi:hypothetical protein
MNLGWRIGIGGGGRRCGFATQDFEHDGPTSRAPAFDGLASVLHGFLNPVGDFFFGFALNAVSFGHKKFAARSPHVPLQLLRIAYGAFCKTVNM